MFPTFALAFTQYDMPSLVSNETKSILNAQGAQQNQHEKAANGSKT